ncbi:MAG: hypothetical protein AAFX99_32890, partial [Myxococcota bacterium]
MQPSFSWTLSHASAAGGAALWCGLLVFPLPTDPLTGWIQRLLPVAPLVIVPLVLTQTVPDRQ